MKMMISLLGHSILVYPYKIMIRSENEQFIKGKLNNQNLLDNYHNFDSLFLIPNQFCN